MNKNSREMIDFLSLMVWYKILDIVDAIKVILFFIGCSISITAIAFICAKISYYIYLIII